MVRVHKARSALLANQKAASVQPLPSWLIWLACDTAFHVRMCDVDIGRYMGAESDKEWVVCIHK